MTATPPDPASQGPDDLLREQLREVLRDGAAALAIELSDAQCNRLLAYQEAVLDWNTRINLTAVREPSAAVERHLLDSLSIVPVWHAIAGADAPRRFLDLGTGGGFPGAPLAVAWPESRGLLIDGTGKKIRVVNDSLERAGILNAEGLQCRGNLLPQERPAVRASFDLCVARAVGAAAPLLREFAPLVRRGGYVFLMKGPEPPADELAQADSAAAECGFDVAGRHASGVPGRDRGLVLAYRAVRTPEVRLTRREREGRGGRRR